jgi:PAS domain S-box-containing protein
MGVEQNYPPYESVDKDGNFTGISADYRKILSQRLGVNLQVQSYPDFSTIHDKLAGKNLDLVLLLTPTAERANFLDFTQPFFDYQLVIVTRDDYPVVFSLDEFRGKKVALVKDYASADYIAKNYPQLNVVLYPTVKDGLLAVSTGKADAFVNEVFATVYQIRNKSISNVKIAAPVNAKLPGYAIGVRNDWPELVGILDKALATITPEERLQVSEKWLSVKYERGFDYSLLWKVVAGALLVFGVLFFWNRRLSNEVATRKRAEAALRESDKRYWLLFERSASAIAILVTDYDENGHPCGYRILDVNPTFEQLTGYKREAVIGQDTTAVLPGFDQYWRDTSGPAIKVGDSATFDQYVAPLDRYFQGIAYSPQPDQFAVSFMDVTQRKRAEDELRKYQHHLEELVQERTADLETKNIALAVEVTERQRARHELEESETNFRAMAENASDAILIATGEHGKYVFANHRAEELTGRSSSELCELELAGLVPPDEQEKVRSIYHAVMQADESPVRYETIYLDVNRTEIPVEITAARIHWHGAIAAMAIVRDISERKRREAEIIQQNYEFGVLAEISNAIRKIDQTSELAAYILQKTLLLSEREWGILAILEEGQLVPTAELSRPAGIAAFPGTLKAYLTESLTSGLAEYNSEASDSAPARQALSPDHKPRIIVPLKSFDNPIGVIALFSAEARPLSPQLRRLMNAIADMAGNGLERVRTMATLEERVADRTRDLSTLYQVMTVANQTDELDQILDQALQLALKAVNCPAGCIYLLDEGEEFLKPVAETGTHSLRLQELWNSVSSSSLVKDITAANRPVLVADLSHEPRLGETLNGGLHGELIGIPLSAAGTVLGVLWGYSDSIGHLTLEDVTLLVSIGERVGTTIENFRLRVQTQQVAVLEERQRLARDLHDSVTQQIYSLLLLAGGAKRNLNQNEAEKSLQLVTRIEAISRQALKELRLLIFELRPLDLMQVGLEEALRQRLESVEERGGVHTQLISQVEGRIPIEIEEQLYRIAIEALNNSLKHAGAADVQVHLRSSGGVLELEVLDNGVGFATARESHGGSGLVGMRERARKIGGSIRINSTPDVGTLIAVKVEVKNG